MPDERAWRRSEQVAGDHAAPANAGSAEESAQLAREGSITSLTIIR
jgi:hypothetical protein